MAIPVSPNLVINAIPLAPQTAAYNSNICPGMKFIAFQVAFNTNLTYSYDFKGQGANGAPPIAQVCQFVVDTTHCDNAVTITFGDSGYEQNILPGTNGALLAVTGLQLPQIFIQSQGSGPNSDYVNITAFDKFFPANLMQQQIIINDNVPSLISMQPVSTNGRKVYSAMGAPGGHAILALTPRLIKGSAASLYSISAWNLDGVSAYINWYDAATAAAVTPGTTTPLFSTKIFSSNSWEEQFPTDDRVQFVNGLVANVSAGSAGSNTAPTSGVETNIGYF